MGWRVGIGDDWDDLIVFQNKDNKSLDHHCDGDTWRWAIERADSHGCKFARHLHDPEPMEVSMEAASALAESLEKACGYHGPVEQVIEISPYLLEGVSCNDILNNLAEYDRSMYSDMPDLITFFRKGAFYILHAREL
jgi:hypothetical protein